MRNQKNRIIIDTNLWISFLINREFSKLDKILYSGKSVLIFNSELLEEFIEVVQRPKLKRFFNQEDLNELLKRIDLYAEFCESESIVNDCRDFKDNFLLSLSKDANVDFIITGDKDLLVLNPYGKTKIITMVMFLEENY